MRTRTACLWSCLLLGAALPAAPAASVSPGAAKILGQSVADVVERVMPAVVVVRTEATRYHLAQDWYYGQLYRVPERLAGLGSGVIMKKEGYVLTNRHVIDEAQHIEVVLNDGTKLPARLVGEDPHTDLAVLQVEAADGRTFPALEAGDSDALRVGELVMAIGSPFSMSLSGSVTMGIVSQKGRSIGALPYEDFIQTDTAINRGNSGGPLVDMDGRVVGINTLIQTAGVSEGNIGISFAIPIKLAMNVAESLIKDGAWKRPWIGILMEEVDNGVAVVRVVPEGPAARSGIREGDVLTAVDDAAVRDPRDVQRAVMGRKAGEKVRITLQRGPKTVITTLETEAMPTPPLLYRQ